MFAFFTLLGLQGFGGLVGIVQRELVDKKGWLTLEEFTDDWALAQALPGPNVINLALMFGERRFGAMGAVAALGGLLGAPLVVLLVITLTLSSLEGNAIIAGALRGMGAVAAALIATAGLKMLPGLRTNVLGLPACSLLGVLTFAAVGLMRFPLPPTMLVLGGIGCAVAYARLKTGSGTL
jgi:chromate transporter